MKRTTLHRLLGTALVVLFLGAGTAFANGGKESSGLQTSAQSSQPSGVVVPKSRVQEVGLNRGKTGGKLEIFSWWSGSIKE